MKKLSHFNLLYIGLFFGSAVLIFTHYNRIPDYVAGGLAGIGIGLMLLPFILNKK